MNRTMTIAALTAAALLASGCSTKPRNFTASVSQPVADRTAFEDDYRTCQTLVRGGRKSDFKAGAATALATGAGTIGTGMAMAGTGLVGITTTGGAAVAATAAMPVVGVFLGMGVSRAIRSGKEKKFKRAMSSCLDEYGYSVERWAKLGKKKDAAAIAAQRATVAAPAIPEDAAPVAPAAAIVEPRASATTEIALAPDQP